MLKTPLINFFKVNVIEAFLGFDAYYKEVAKNIKDVKTKLKNIKIERVEFNIQIQNIVDEEINPIKLNNNNVYRLNLEKLYQLTESGKENFELPVFNIDYKTIYYNICKEFFQQIFRNTEYINEENFFKRVLQAFKLNLKKNGACLVTSEMKPNSDSMKFFFESLLNNQIIFNGCSEYIQSIFNQQYPENIVPGVTRELLDEAIRLYELSLNNGRTTDDQTTLQSVADNAITVISSFYKTTIVEKIQAQYPTFIAQTSDHWANLFQTALFSKIHFANYPELDATFNQAFDDFDHNDQHTQDTIKRLVLNAHQMVKQGITKSKWKNFIKWTLKKYRLLSWRQKITLSIAFVLGAWCIITLAHKRYIKGLS